jgi:uncharacterized repeat protein (TIGR04076 family)
MAEKQVQKKTGKGVKGKAAKSQYVTYPVRIKVISQKGTCSCLHKVGQEWTCKYEADKPPQVPNICFAALMPILYNLKALWWGAPIPAPVPDPDTFFCCCPDPLNPVVFELKRLKDKPIYLHFPEKLDEYLDRKKISAKLKKK